MLAPNPHRPTNAEVVEAELSAWRELAAKLNRACPCKLLETCKRKSRMCRHECKWYELCDEPPKLTMSLSSKDDLAARIKAKPFAVELHWRCQDQCNSGSMPQFVTARHILQLHPPEAAAASDQDNNNNSSSSMQADVTLSESKADCCLLGPWHPTFANLDDGDDWHSKFTRLILRNAQSNNNNNNNSTCNVINTSVVDMDSVSQQWSSAELLVCEGVINQSSAGSEGKLLFRLHQDALMGAQNQVCECANLRSVENAVLGATEQIELTEVATSVVGMGLPCHWHHDNMHEVRMLEALNNIRQEHSNLQSGDSKLASQNGDLVQNETIQTKTFPTHSTTTTINQD